MASEFPDFSSGLGWKFTECLKPAHSRASEGDKYLSPRNVSPSSVLVNQGMDLKTSQTHQEIFNEELPTGLGKPGKYAVDGVYSKESFQADWIPAPVCAWESEFPNCGRYFQFSSHPHFQSSVQEIQRKYLTYTYLT